MALPEQGTETVIRSSTIARIEAALAQPCTHRVTTLYANGTTKTRDTRSLAAAQNWAIGESRRIGLNLIDRATGNFMQVIDVTISEIAKGASQ